MGAKRGPVRLDDQQTAAEALAIAALTFIAGEPEPLGRFLALTGIGPESIRAAAHEPRFLLGVLGVVMLPRLLPSIRLAFVVLAIGVTAFGVAWLSNRSHDVGDALGALNRRPEPVLVSTIAHLDREGGAYYDDKHWLTATTAEQRMQAAKVVRDAGYRSFGLVDLFDPKHEEPDIIGGFRRTGATRLRFFPGVSLRLTTYMAG